MSIATQAAKLLAWLNERSVPTQQGATLTRMHVRALYRALGPIWLNGLNGIGGTLTVDQLDGLAVLNDMFNIGDNPVKMIEFAKGKCCPLIDGDLETEPRVYATLLVALKLLAKQPAVRLPVTAIASNGKRIMAGDLPK